MRRHEAPQSDDEQARQNAPDRGAQIGLGERRIAVGAAKQVNDQFDVPEDEPHRHRVDDRDPEPLPHGPADCPVLPRAQRLRHHRRRRHDDAHSEQVGREQDIAAQRSGRQIVATEPSHHENVGRVHRDLRQLGKRQRNRQAQSSRDFTSPRRFARDRRVPGVPDIPLCHGPTMGQSACHEKWRQASHGQFLQPRVRSGFRTP